MTTTTSRTTVTKATRACDRLTLTAWLRFSHKRCRVPTTFVLLFLAYILPNASAAHPLVDVHPLLIPSATFTVAISARTPRDRRHARRRGNVGGRCGEHAQRAHAASAALTHATCTPRTLPARCQEHPRRCDEPVVARGGRLLVLCAHAHLHGPRACHGGPASERLTAEREPSR
eukprot:scaffold39692_cov58-Phaeocystis_antarctica.AAC.2